MVSLIHESLYDYITGVDNKHLFDKPFTLLDLSLTYSVLLIWAQKKKPFKKVLIFFLAVLISFILEDVFFYEKGQLRYSLVDPLFNVIITLTGIDTLVFVLKNTKEKKEKVIKACIAFFWIISTTQFVLFNFFSYFLYDKTNAFLFGLLYLIYMSFFALTNMLIAFSFIWIPQKQQYL